MTDDRYQTSRFRDDATIRQTEMSRKIRLTILIGGSLFVIAMAYGSGMRRQVKVLRAQYEQVKAFKQEARLAQIDRRGRDAQLQQWEARRLLDRAERAATHGDRGTAQTLLSEAATRLETAQKADAASTADLADLAQELKTADPAHLTQLIERMDAALTAVAPAPDALSPLTIPAPTLNDVPAGNDVARPIGADGPRSGW